MLESKASRMPRSNVLAIELEPAQPAAIVFEARLAAIGVADTAGKAGCASLAKSSRALGHRAGFEMETAPADC